MKAPQIPGPGDGVHQHAPEDRPECVELVLERRDDAEVAAAAAKAPEQIGVLALARVDEAAVGRHHVGRKQVVARESVHAHQPADAAAKRQPGNASGRHRAAGRGQAERLRFVIELLVGDARFRADARLRLIDANRLHRRKVDHHATIAHRPAADVVSAAADGERQALVAGKRQRSNHVRRSRAADNGRRPAIDGGVVDSPNGVVALIGGSDHRAAQVRSKRAQGFWRHGEILYQPGVGRASWGSRRYDSTSMIPWELLGRTATPGGEEMALMRHSGEYVILAGGKPLMSSRMHGSEEALAEVACQQARGLDEPCVLVGGLGMGFTLRATLDALPPAATVVVAELVEGVVEWNRGPLGSPRRRSAGRLANTRGGRRRRRPCCAPRAAASTRCCWTSTTARMRSPPRATPGSMATRGWPPSAPRSPNGHAGGVVRARGSAIRSAPALCRLHGGRRARAGATEQGRGAARDLRWTAPGSRHSTPTMKSAAGRYCGGGLRVGVVGCGSRRGLLRSLERAQRQLVHLVDDLRVRARRRLQAGPRHGLRRLQVGVEVVVVFTRCRRRAGTGRTSSCRSPVASDSGRDPSSRRTA